MPLLRAYFLAILIYGTPFTNLVAQVCNCNDLAQVERRKAEDWALIGELRPCRRGCCSAVGV